MSAYTLCEDCGQRPKWGRSYRCSECIRHHRTKRQTITQRERRSASRARRETAVQQESELGPDNSTLRRKIEIVGAKFYWVGMHHKSLERDRSKLKGHTLALLELYDAIQELLKEAK